jgi:nitrate/nitrite transporter NarK
MFSIFLFLTFYLIVSLGYSPIEGGLAFLPMVAGIVLSSTTVPSLLLPRVGPKIVISSSFLVSAVGMVWLTQLELGSSFVADVLPGLVLLGIGLGGAMTTAFQGATAGVHHQDAGVASALINTSQQVGGSISTALLTTVAASAMTDYLTSHQPGPLTVGAGPRCELHGHVHVGHRNIRGRCGDRGVPGAECSSGTFGRRIGDGALSCSARTAPRPRRDDAGVVLFLFGRARNVRATREASVVGLPTWREFYRPAAIRAF